MRKLQSLRKREVLLSFKRDLAKVYTYPSLLYTYAKFVQILKLNIFLQSMEATSVAEEWVDHTLGQARVAKGKLETAEKSHVDSEKRLKDALFHLAKVRNLERMLNLPWPVMRNWLRRVGLPRKGWKSAGLDHGEVQTTAKTTRGQGRWEG